MLMDAPLSLTRPKRAAASATVVKIGQSLREQDSTITEARTYPSALPVVTKRAKHVWACEQGRQRNRGSGVCEHGRKRCFCKDCGGKGLCGHGRRRRQCKECGGAGICEHGRERNYCKDCGGSQICKHSKRRSYCKECRGGAARGPLEPRTVQQALTVSEGTVHEGWDVVCEDEEFRDALAVQLFAEDELFAEVDWEDVNWDW